jgi:hypothetical protein
LKTKFWLLHISKALSSHGIFKEINMVLAENGLSEIQSSCYSYLGLAGYLTGASNLRKRSRDNLALAGQPLDDDAKVEDASEAPVNER